MLTEVPFEFSSRAFILGQVYNISIYTNCMTRSERRSIDQPQLFQIWAMLRSVVVCDHKTSVPGTSAVLVVKPKVITDLRTRALSRGKVTLGLNLLRDS